MSLKIFLSVFIGLFLISGCSTNQDDPLGPDNQDTANLELTVTAAEVYYLNIGQGITVPVDNYRMEDTWDIAIDNLTRVRLNSGSTAPGSVFAVQIDGQSYENITTAPDVMYHVDTQNELAIGESWYFYDINTHTVNPLDVVYVIRAGDGSFYKFKITAANFTSRTDGKLSLRFDKISAPTSPQYPNQEGRVQYFKLDLSATEDTYFSFDQGGAITIADPQASTEWDFKSSFVTISVNGGTSGPGQGSAVEFQSADFDSVLSAPADGYVSDNGDDTKAIGDKWYTYDFMTHTLSVNSNIYVVKTAQGNYAKLEFVETDFANQGAGVALIRYHYITNGNSF